MLPACYLNLHLACGRSPDPELGHASAASARISKATGSRRVRSLSRSRVLAVIVPDSVASGAPGVARSAGGELVTRNSVPVSTSRQRPAGTASAASRQPPDRRRPAGSLVATVITWPPRQNATTCAAAAPLQVTC